MANLSKLKINNVVYDLKDATARSNVETLLGTHTLSALGDAAWKAVASEISGTGLVEASVVKSYVDSAVAAIPEFDVVVVTELPTASDKTFHKIYLIAQSSTTGSNIYDEYITVRSGTKGSYTYSWEKIGSTDIDISSKVDKTTTICGITLEKNISTIDLQAALGLKKLAYKDSAAATVTDYATGITGASYTPAGSVTIAKDDNGVQISGTVSAPSITITPATAEVQHLTSVGKLPTYKAASYTAPSVSESKGTFATAGMVASVDTTDTEMLVFSDASTSNALTATGFNAGSYTAAVYTQGSLPVLGDKQTVVTGITKATATAPTFTGNKFGATFTGTGTTITPTLATGSKTITVE